MVLAFGGIAPTGQNYASIALFNAIFGGEGYSRLFRLAREEMGLCYHIASYVETTLAAVMVECALDAADFIQVRQVVEEELQRIRCGEISVEETDRARQFLADQLIGLEDSQEGTARFCLQRQTAEIPLRRHDLMRLWEKTDLAAVQRVAQGLKLSVVYCLEARPA